MLRRLQEELDQADMEYPDCRAVVINSNSNGGKAFSAGHDMKEIHRHVRENSDEILTRQLFDTCAVVMQSLSQIRPVTIASVDGIATAAGCQLVAATDMAIATQSSRLALSGIHHGLVCSTPIVPVSRAMMGNNKHALEMLLTGDFISAHQACTYGLINTVVTDKDALEEATHELVSKIARHSSYATARGKQHFYQQGTMKLSDAYASATDRIVDDIVHSVDARNGIHAFVEKRPQPKWESK